MHQFPQSLKSHHECKFSFMYPTVKVKDISMKCTFWIINERTHNTSNTTLWYNGTF